MDRAFFYIVASMLVISYHTMNHKMFFFSTIYRVMSDRSCKLHGLVTEIEKLLCAACQQSLRIDYCNMFPLGRFKVHEWPLALKKGLNGICLFAMVVAKI